MVERRRSAITSVAAVAVAAVLVACSDDPEPAATSERSPIETSSAATEPATTPVRPPTTPATSEVTATVAPSTPASTEVTATVAPSTPTPTSTSMPAPVRDFAAIGPRVQAVVDDLDLAGAGLIVVDRDDGVVHEEYWGGFDADRRSFVASSSKMITAGVLVRLDDDGLLDIDAPITDQTGWAGNPELTPAQLVSNTSGLVGLFPDLLFEPYACQFAPDGDIEACGAAIFETPDDDADVVAPDTGFRYGGGQWQVAGALAEHVSGRTWAELIHEIYVEPCGVETLSYNNHFAITRGLDYPVGLDPTSLGPTENPNMEAGVSITVPDYGRLLLMHLRGGRCGDRQVISPEGTERLHTDRTITLPGGDSLPGYAMGWWVDRGSGRLSDPGAYGAEPWIDLDLGYGAYLVVEADGPTGRAIRSVVEPLIDEVMAGSS